MKDIRQKLTNKITQLENKEFLSPEEETRLGRLRLTNSKPRLDLEEYSLTQERAELSRLQETGLCLSQQVAKACETIVLDAVRTLI
ncbi:uncharacterized protein LOC113464073 [Ceratina calcarata]|uniref:Uncharacterized protein LOC113464073 n=1 Tax=Ceratina calcarata TaxID=156304 RepID=A0AAJ7W918_9HYME|nr:uncharacterized protein LOC113464073 [Ceratina calcarata]